MQKIGIYLIGGLMLMLFNTCKKESKAKVLFTPGSGCTDIEGNTYPTAIIGAQEWMTVNLKATKFNNGDAIANITGETAWQNTSSAAWCYYNNDAQFDNAYGKLYNGYVVNGNVCPAGWHVPSSDDFTELTDYLGGPDYAGGTMKSTTSWDSPNEGADNSSGFNALPAGGRDYQGNFIELGTEARFWNDIPTFTTDECLTLQNTSRRVFPLSFYSTSGFSIRCVKN